jgi:Tfp pilus assembly protein PilF
VQPVVVPLAAEAPIPVRKPAPGRPPTAQAGEGATGRAEVRKDILETTRRQLLQAIEIDPDNARAHAMLLATHYQLGWMDAVMQTLRLARSRGIQAAELRAVPRCEQLLSEEEQACRLPLDLHSEFMQYLGG